MVIMGLFWERYNLVSERTGFEFFGYVGSDLYLNGFVSLDRDLDVLLYAYMITCLCDYLGMECSF